MVLCGFDCTCMECEMKLMAKHPVYKPRIQNLVDEFRADSNEFVSWQKKYSLWDAENLTITGIREEGPYIWAITGHPVLDILRCNVGILPDEPDGVWNVMDKNLFESGCLTLRLRFDFLRK